MLELQFKVNQITPYIINIKDLETTKFKVAKKRVLIYTFDFMMDMRTYVAPADMSLLTPRDKPEVDQLLDGRNPPKKPVMKFVNKNTIEGSLTTLQAQVSMDDLYVVQQLGKKATDEALEVG